jgi:hypothetical protein
MEEKERAMAQINDDHSDIAVARLVGRCLLKAARTVGIQDPERMRLQTLCERIVMASQRGGLDPVSYRLAWMMMRENGPH